RVEVGCESTGFDVDPSKPERIAAGDSYIDAVAPDTLKHLVGSGQLAATTDFSRLADADVVVICVPTPLNEQREPDLSYVERTSDTIARHITADTLVVLESTTYPRTTREVVGPRLEDSGLTMGTEIFLGFSPEREDPGNTSFNTRSIPKVVAGLGETAGDMVEAFYGAVVDTVVRVPTTETAEAVKITENIFRAVNIALVNELKLVFDAMDIDVWDVIDGAATKPFGFMPFYPGPGLGGHCIPIDPFYLTWIARRYQVPTRFIELAGEINTAMPYHVVNRTREIIDRASGRGLNGADILLVGLAYKKNVSDVRESPAMKILELLEEAGAKVSYLDPHVPEIPPMREYMAFRGRGSLDMAEAQSKGFAAALIATDHDAVDYPALLTLGCPVVDTRNAIARRDLASDNVVKV
ncbi:MAG: nucleotide sugar dehydrogenase, partial [Pseudomonadota bacterium]